MNDRVDAYFERLRGKRAVVLGIGVSNRPLIRMLLEYGAEVTACDKTPREKLDEEVLALERLGAQLHVGEDYLEGLEADVVFRTPGMRPDLPQIRRLTEGGAQLTSEMEAFFDVCPCTRIAVTGSDGKTTTTTLIAKILEHAGKKVWIGGNIGQPLLPLAKEMSPEDFAVVELSSFQLMTMTSSAVAISGISDIHIGDTLCSPEKPEPIPFQKISEPTISMNFLVNDSPLAGQEGKYITSRHLRDRLFRELNTDVSLRVEETENTDCFKVSGRGELHLSVLIENMRREGYEFAVSKAEVIYKKDENGKLLEPMETAVIDVPDEFTGIVIEKLSLRKGELIGMSKASGGYSRLEFNIPSRGLIGYRGEFLTDTKGNGILNTLFNEYGPYKGDIAYRQTGSLIAFESGETLAYGLFNAQDRGTLFVGPGEKVYGGMIVGQNPKGDDIELNVCKAKHLTNTRASGSDDALKLTPPRILSLEEALDFIENDELVEVTPKSIRMRKKILDTKMRMRANRK